MLTATRYTGTRQLTKETVLVALDADESNGHAVAAFSLTTSQTAWQPDATRPAITGPGVVLYERQFGRIEGRKA